MILVKAASIGTALEAFFGWVAGWDDYEAEHGLDGGIWQAAFQEAKARAPLGSLEGILFSPFAAWQEALKIATQTDDALTVIGKDSNVISSPGEIDIMKGNNELGNYSKWIDEAGNIKWPANNGFEGAPIVKTLNPGTIVDRYGGETGKFVSPQGTPYEKRSLFPISSTRPYNAYEIVKPIDVRSGKIAPWFDQPGGGIQYQFSESIEKLIQLGYLRRLP